jgi:hypothetical protein
MVRKDSHPIPIRLGRMVGLLLFHTRFLVNGDSLVRMLLKIGILLVLLVEFLQDSIVYMA